MNTQSFERQLQQINPPVPDAEARLHARHAAVAEFERLQGQRDARPARTWTMPKLWLGGFATACVVVVGVSIMWMMPASERAIAPPAAVPQGPQAADQTEEKAAVSSATAASTKAQAKSGTAPMAIKSTIKRELAPRSTATEKAAAALANGAVVQPQPAMPEPPPTALIAEMTTQPVPPATPAARASEELSEVLVTGSRIQSPEVRAANPITSISAEEMRRLGIVNVADALSQLVPQNVSTYKPQATDARDKVSAANTEKAFVGNTIANLRGLDPAYGGRTLTLVDGRRVVSSSNQADVVDPNVIPRNLLQRMDVVTGGAAATYDQGGDKFAHFEINPVKRTADEPVSTFSADVDTASYSFVRRELNNGMLPPADAVRSEEMINYFDYAWPAASSRDQPFKPTVIVSDSPWNKGRKLVHIGIKGYELPVKQRPDVNLVLLLDVSGSMTPPDRLPLAQRSMALLLDSLKPTDTVGIAVYAGAAGEVLPPTPVSQKDVILRALYSLRPGGSTAGAAGIRLAYEMAERNFRKGGVNRVLLATDGDFNVGIRDVNELKSFVQQKRDGGVFLSVLGVGHGNYHDDMAQTLAQNGNGVAAYIDTLNEARKVLVQEAGAQLFTIAKDVKLQVEFNPATVAEYRLIGYETRALNREDFNNDKVDAGDIGSGHTVTAIYEITPVDAEAKLIDERRYGKDEKAAPRGKADEYGYLKIRYKLPDGTESKLIEQPIALKTSVPSALRQDVQFATAVAGFAQLLQGGRYTGTLDYDDVYREGQQALGRDPDGYRAEFLQLVRRAQGTVRR